MPTWPPRHAPATRAGQAPERQVEAEEPRLASPRFDFANIPVHSVEEKPARIKVQEAMSFGMPPDTGSNGFATPRFGTEEADRGQPLEAGLRGPLEQFFERPLDQVRVFFGPSSRRAAESLDAYALTHGQDIHVGERGRSLPARQQRALFAHEVAHTIQQGDAASAPQLSALTPDAADSPAERQADGLSRAFMAHERADSAGLAIRDCIGLHSVSSHRAQLARFNTNFGEFEDYKFNELTAGPASSVPTGTKLGVQIRLKFHPGNNVDATKIGLTQAADTVIDGSRHADDLIARRSATSGPGVGFHIDVPEKHPSPMYAASDTPKAKADPTELGSYNAPGIGPLPKGGDFIGGNNVIGIDYGGGSIYGYRYTVGGKLHGPVPAELHDAPQDPTASPSSKQVFETAALAMEGTMAGTYLGSVEWGWQRDANGAFSTIPVKVTSRGVPSANFLTAATIWNASKEDIGFVASAAHVDILDPSDASKIVSTVSRGTRLRFIASGTLNGTTFFLMETIGTPRSTGIVDTTEVSQEDVGRDTVKLPVPEVFSVNVASILGATQGASSGPTLPQGTRVRMVVGPVLVTAGFAGGGTDRMHKQLVDEYAGATGVENQPGLQYTRGYADWLQQQAKAPDSVSVEVVDGPLTGRTGFVPRSSLTKEPLGTR
jgi:Domain of unknown function (DUF4157)